MAPMLLSRLRLSQSCQGISTRQRQGSPCRERRFRCSARGGPGEVWMGWQASIEEDVGWWEVSQNLLEARISRALLVLTAHSPTDGPWAIQPQGRDEKGGEDPAQKGETRLGRDVASCGTEGTL